MKIFDKKIIISTIILCIILCVAIYFITNDEGDDFSSFNNIYISNNTPTADSVSEIVIHIAGEVVNPGIVSIPVNSRISDAIESAGGATNLADISKINLAYILKDGQKVYIPSIYDEASIEYITNNAGENILVPDSSSSNSLININTATSTELETLSGIGASTAQKIIKYREENGNFKSIEDLMNVSGIGEAKFNAIKDFICI